jgi:hypothetical protein
MLVNFKQHRFVSLVMDDEDYATLHTGQETLVRVVQSER